MATYTYPEMPLTARVWWVATTVPPGVEPDEDAFPCSLSPMRPAEFWGTGPLAYQEWMPTYVIRCPWAPELTDNYTTATPFSTLPCTVWEIPPGSGHFYMTTWGHQVGAGFANHHSRAYVTRWTNGQPPGGPYFQGWI